MGKRERSANLLIIAQYKKDVTYWNQGSLNWWRHPEVEKWKRLKRSRLKNPKPLSRKEVIDKLANLKREKFLKLVKPFGSKILPLYLVKKIGSKSIAKELMGELSATQIEQYLKIQGVYRPGSIPYKKRRFEKKPINWQALIINEYQKDLRQWDKLEWKVSNHPDTKSYYSLKRYHEELKHDPDYMEKQRVKAQIIYKSNPKKKNYVNKKWRKENPDKVSAYRKTKKYKAKIKDWMRSDTGKEWLKNYKNKPEVKIVKNLRNRLKDIMKSNGKRPSKLIGCSAEFLKGHLENQFKRNMNWDNYGKHWHVDHIIPCAAYDLSNNKEALACFNWQNLRPLEAKRNMSKGSTITEPQQHLVLVV
jgi:hypothetical protein